MKPIRCLLFLPLLLWSLFSTAQVARLVKETVRVTQKYYWLQKVAGVDRGPQDWSPLTSSQGLTLQARGAAISKPVSRAYSNSFATLNFDLYKTLTFPDGFVPTSFYTRSDVPLSKQLRYVGLLEAGQGWTASEQADQSLKNRQYYDVPGGVLGVYENAQNFVDASVSTILSQLNANLNPNAIGSARVVFNFEQTYLPSGSSHPDNLKFWDNNSGWIETQGVVQTWPDAETHTWVCESNELAGQTKTIRWLFDNNKLLGELQQRLVNRHTAALKFVKAKCGPNTIVANGDGSQVYQNGSIAYDDTYATTKAATQDRGYTAAFWSLGANFPAVTVGGVTVSGNGSTFWQTQGFLNNYSYQGVAFVTPADFNYITGLGTGQYREYWAKLRMGNDRPDVNIPASFLLNRAKLIQKGMPDKPVVQQSHNRIERAIVSDDGRESEMGNLGPDARLAAPWMVEMWTMVTRFVATRPGDGFTLWTTIKRAGPGTSTIANQWSNRHLDERMAMYTGLARLANYNEYFTPSRQPKLFGPDDMYVRYTNGITGGNWAGTQTPVITDGGDGFYRRGAAMIVQHTSGQDVRSQTGVMARIVLKNGVRWALIQATNPNTTSLSTFDVRFKAAETGAASDLDVTGLSVSGKETMLVEVCLEPGLQVLPTLTSIGSTSGGSSPPPSTTTTTINRVAFVGNSITNHSALASIGWDKNNGMAASSPAQDYVHRVMARINQTYPSAQYSEGRSDGIELNFRTYDPATDNILNGALASPTNAVILRFGENTNDGDVSDGVFANKLSAYVDYVRSRVPAGTPIVLTTSCWPQPNTNTVIRSVAAQKSCLLVDLGDMWTFEGDTGNPFFAFGQWANAFVARHPSDAGMAEIARRILNVMPGFGTTAPPVAGGSTPENYWGFDWQPIAESARPAGNKAVVQSGNARLENWLHYGGATNHISLSGGANMVNWADFGRSNGIALYYKTGPYLPPGVEFSDYWQGIGWNPIEAGDFFNNGSPILNFGVRQSDGMQYIKVRPLHWHLRNYPDPHTTFEKWTKPLGQVTGGGYGYRVWHRAIVNRTDDLTQPEAVGHEFPYTYPTIETGEYHYYTGNSPWTSGPTTTITTEKQTEKVSENWVAARNPQTGVGFGLVGSVGSVTVKNFTNLGGGTGELAPNTGYMGVDVMTIAGPQETHLLTYDYVIGTPQQVRTYAYSLPRPNNTPRYIFNTGREKCVFEKATYAIQNGALVLTAKTKQAGLSTPFERPFAASGISTIYVRMKNESPRSGFYLKFVKPGQQDANTQGQLINFTVPNDGQYYTVAVPVGANSAWNGIIANLSVYFQRIGEENLETAVSGHVIRYKWLSTTDLTTTNP